MPARCRARRPRHRSVEDGRPASTFVQTDRRDPLDARRLTEPLTRGQSITRDSRAHRRLRRHGGVATRSSPGSSASRSRSIAVTSLVARARRALKRRAGRMQVLPAQPGRGGRRRPSDCASGGSPRSSHEPSGAADQLLALGELAQRGRDGRPAGADELPEDPVGERQRDDHAVAGDAAPALGEVPEQRLQAAVDARELRDRLRGREPQRALAEAVEQRGGDLRVARQPRRRSGGRARPRVSGDSDRPHGVDGQQAGCGWRSATGARRSPGPSSSALTWSATTSSRASTPSSTSRPTWSALAPARRETSHGPTRQPVGADDELALGLRAPAAREQARRDPDRLRAAGRISEFRLCVTLPPATTTCLPAGVGFQTPAMRGATTHRHEIRRGRPCGGSARRPCRRATAASSVPSERPRERDRAAGRQLRVADRAARGRFEPLERRCTRSRG